MVNPKIEHGVDLDRDVVARDHVLRRHVVDDDAEIDLRHLLYERHQDNEAGALDPGEAAESEKSRRAGISRRMRIAEVRKIDGDHRDEEVGEIIEHHAGPSFGGRRVRPAPHLQGQAIDGRDLDRLAGGEGFVAAGLPAFAISAHVACPARQSRISAGRPCIARAPTRGGRRRARQSTRPTKTTRAKASTAGRPTTVGDRRKQRDRRDRV